MRNVLTIRTLRARGPESSEGGCIGAGDVTLSIHVNGSHPQHSFQRDGLPSSVNCPSHGEHRFVGRGERPEHPLPAPFLLVAVLERPTQTPLNRQHVVGTYAGTFPMNAGGTLTGATSQISTDSVRLNVVSLGLTGRSSMRNSGTRWSIAAPSDFALALKVHRTAAPAAGRAWLFVGNTNADSVDFDFRLLTCHPDHRFARRDRHRKRNPLQSGGLFAQVPDLDPGFLDVVVASGVKTPNTVLRVRHLPARNRVVASSARASHRLPLGD